MTALGTNEMNNDYKKAQFKKMVAETDLNLSGDCPLIEDEALVWADKEIIALRVYNKQLIAALRDDCERSDRLEKALKQAIIAMRAPLDGWKGDVERVALDMANDALK
jgi:hypothetical protein